MSLSLIEVIVMACMYDEDRIGKHHGNVERILKFCTPKEYRDREPLSALKKRLRQLASAGYLILKRGRSEAYSLSQKGVIVAERWKEGWTLDEINEAEQTNE
jgi:hypothetical protein